MNGIYYAVAHRSQEEIDSFKTRYDDFDTNLIPQIFKYSLGFEAVGWKQPQSWGMPHVVYFVKVKQQKRPLVLRANTGFNSQPEVTLLVEKLVTDEVAKKTNVPVNKILHVDVSRKKYPFDFQIQEKLEGKDLEDHFKGRKDQYDKMSFQLGVYAAKIHQLVYPGFGRFDEKAALKGKLQGSKKNFFNYLLVCLDEDLKYLVNANVINYKTNVKIRKLFDTYRDIINVKPGVLIHHDLADHNIMFKNNQITAIFDWEACGVGDPVLDLASCPTWRTHYPREKKLIEGYQSIASLPDNFQEKMNLYRLRTLLWKMVFATRANILSHGRRQRLYSALKPFKIKLAS